MDRDEFLRWFARSRRQPVRLPRPEDEELGALLRAAGIEAVAGFVPGSPLVAFDAVRCPVEEKSLSAVAAGLGRRGRILLRVPPSRLASLLPSLKRRQLVMKALGIVYDREGEQPARELFLLARRAKSGGVEVYALSWQSSDNEGANQHSTSPEHLV